ncbi:restriction endonuclease subunit S [Planctomycetota bacterium]
MQYSIVNIKEIQQSVFGGRIDAEFYLPVYLDSDAAINKIGYRLLDAITSKIDVGHVGSMVNEYAINGVWLLQTQNVKEFFLDESSKIFINAKFHDYLKKSKVRKGDILIARSGSFGTASIYLEDEEINSADIIIIKPLKEQVNPYYLITFLNCKYGTNQLLRFASGGLQGHVNLTILEKLKVCNPSESTQRYIEAVVKESYLSKKASEELYNQSQTILLSELGLTNWQPEHALSFVKNYSDAEQAERIDAEYFQPKYEKIENAIKSYAAGYSLIKDEFKQNKSTFKPDDKKNYQYVEIGSINVSSGEVEANEVLGIELPANAKRVLKKNDVVISKVRTYRGAITIIDKDGYVGSGAFTVLHEKGRINKETLFVFLHSKPLLAWSLKPNTGTSYPVIIDDDILNLPIPLFREKVQAQIQEKITESFALRKESKHLLECAKRAVEIAIEQDEKTAMRWIEEQTETMKI